MLTQERDIYIFKKNYLTKNGLVEKLNINVNQLFKEKMMRLIKYLLIVLIILVFFTGSAFAQDFFVYPTKGQSLEQQKKDESECYQWAKQQTGFDPLQTPPQASAPPPQKGSKGPGMLEGAIIGGAGGAGIGALTSPSSKRGSRAGKGALIGAGAGALLGHMAKERRTEKEQQQSDQWTQSQMDAYNQSRDAFKRAYGACLEGRGYTVK